MRKPRDEKIKGIVPRMREELAEMRREHRHIEDMFNKNIQRQVAKELRANIRRW
jgi:hypothetical protein